MRAKARSAADAPDGGLPAAAPDSLAETRGARRRRIAELLVCGFLPGALVGAHLAGLLFFLNPALPWRPAPVFKAICWYALELGVLGIVLHLPLAARRRPRPRRLLPWSLTIALTLAAVLDWTHASHYAYYLPTGINERLIKTAIWLSVAALIAFYTALLHTLDRRRYGWRSRLALVLLYGLSIFVMIERRAAFHPPPALPPRPAVVERVPRPRLWVIGLDTATLDAILPLAGQGQLPFLAGILRQGAYGRLESLSPVRPEALWTTLATGKYPWQHGVTGGRLYSAQRIGRDAELRLLPVGIAFNRWGLPAARSRLLHGHSRQALALWEILPRLGIPSGVVGWPASSPVSSEPLLALSDHYFGGRAEAGDFRPPQLDSWARKFRPEPRAVRAELASRFGRGSPPPLAASFLEDQWRESLSEALLDRHPEMGAFFLELPGLRQISRRYFGGFSSVQFHAIQTPDFVEAAARVTDYYIRLDSFLAELWQRHTGDDILALVSASGIEGSTGWRRMLGELSREASLEGFEADAPDGVLMLYGEGVQPGALLTGARLVDLVPTLMYALHLPVARDLDGEVLTPAFEKSFLARHPLTFLPTYETLPATIGAAGAGSEVR
ncbi:MAG TPA: alkaline phosphatase family protein [Thermoanaerobaculia bacterium]|nr:alkaline phosphatase family protein [Thermoanaerobaculia bacterium]